MPVTNLSACNAATHLKAVYVLHVFQKKTAKTATLDIEVARQRYRRLLEERR